MRNFKKLINAKLVKLFGLSVESKVSLLIMATVGKCVYGFISVRMQTPWCFLKMLQLVGYRMCVTV
jgi:hypothetical protein